MDIDFSKTSFEIFCEIASEFAPCMNDYLYVYDLANDTYYITERALERFHIEKNIFSDVTNTLRTLTHPDDYDM